MFIIAEKDKCCGCGACATLCPEQCIEMIESEEGFLFPEINAEKCICCDSCRDVCPAINSIPKSDSNKLNIYAGYSFREETRKHSSSGGIFTMLAEYVLHQNGVVFGAAFSSDYHKVNHIEIQQIKDIELLRGSKYVESVIGDTYQRARGFLEKGRKVLFSGTPCQIEGLQLYLHKNYSNLLCVDLICHGIPSAKVWDKYLSFRENDAGAPVKRVSFRNKTNGWEKYSVSMEFANGVHYMVSHLNDIYMKAFLKNISIRPSCEQCWAKGVNRNSDITLADFWGVKNIAPELYDDKGTSLIMVHTKKGERVIDDIKERMKYKEIENVSMSLKYNPSVMDSIVHHERRKEFFSQLDIMPFDELVFETIIKEMPRYHFLGDYVNILKENKVYVYGAGKIAGELIDVLKMIKIQPAGVLVTNLSDNPQTFHDYPVKTLNDIEKDNSKMVVIIAVSEKYQEEICSLLKSNQINQMICCKN